MTAIFFFSCDSNLTLHCSAQQIRIIVKKVLKRLESIPSTFFPLHMGPVPVSWIPHRTLSFNRFDLDHRFLFSYRFLKAYNKSR